MTKVSRKVQFWMGLLQNAALKPVSESISMQHWQLCHADGSVCPDGCDASALPGEAAAMNEAADRLGMS